MGLNTRQQATAHASVPYAAQAGSVPDRANDLIAETKQIFCSRLPNGSGGAKQRNSHDAEDKVKFFREF
jgi:hypothetical protein